MSADECGCGLWVCGICRPEWVALALIRKIAQDPSTDVEECQHEGCPPCLTVGSGINLTDGERALIEAMQADDS